jgi:hypothetical protein
MCGDLRTKKPAKELINFVKWHHCIAHFKLLCNFTKIKFQNLFSLLL